MCALIRFMTNLFNYQPPAALALTAGESSLRRCVFGYNTVRIEAARKGSNKVLLKWNQKKSCVPEKQLEQQGFFRNAHIS